MERPEKLGQELYELGLRLGALGAVAIGSGGGELARTLARAAGCGAALAGGEVKFHDGGCAGCGAWLGRYYHLPATLFIRQEEGEVAVYLTDGQGRSFHRQLKTDGPEGAVGQWDLMAGAYCTRLATQARWCFRRTGRDCPSRWSRAARRCAPWGRTRLRRRCAMWTSPRRCPPFARLRAARSKDNRSRPPVRAGGLKHFLLRF